MFVVNMKILFQDLCATKVTWDDELVGSQKKKFDSFIAQLSSLQSVRISRCLFNRTLDIDYVQIHALSDASEKAYASVVYLHIVYVSDEIDSQFLASKAKFSSLKKQGIPRLELLGACLMSKLVDSISHTHQDELASGKIDRIYCMDSIAALCWVKNDRAWKTYVQNRVSDILKLSSREEW